MTVNYSQLTKEICQKSMLNVRDDLQNFTVDEIRLHQPKMGFSVCSVNILGDLNAGTMMRTAVLYGADEFFIAGRRKFNRCSTVGAMNYIDINMIDCMTGELDIDSKKILDTILAAGYVPVVCETSGTDIRSYQFPERPCFIFGNEGLGLPQDMIEAVKEKVSIHQFGVMRSHNVSVAASIVMHEFTRNF